MLRHMLGSVSYHVRFCFKFQDVWFGFISAAADAWPLSSVVLASWSDDHLPPVIVSYCTIIFMRAWSGQVKEDEVKFTVSQQHQEVTFRGYHRKQEGIVQFMMWQRNLIYSTKRVRCLLDPFFFVGFFKGITDAKGDQASIIRAYSVCSPLYCSAMTLNPCALCVEEVNLCLFIHLLLIM